MSEQDKQKGLYNKYVVTRSDGQSNEDGAQFFVLRYDRSTDYAARAALRAYMGAISDTDPELAKDLRKVLEGLEARSPVNKGVDL